MSHIRFIDHFLVHRRHKLVDISMQMPATQLGHTTGKYFDILLLAGIYKRLDIFGFIFLEHLGDQHSKLPLQLIHQQAAGPPVAIGTMMDGHQLVARP